MLKLADKPYEHSLRLGDTVQAVVCEERGGPRVTGMVTEVLEHGWYVDVAVHVGGGTARLRLFREPEHRRHSPVIACRVVRRKDNRQVTKYSGG